MGDRKMRLAYFTSVYARASDTFVRTEVVELRRRGHEVHTFSIRRQASDAKVSAEVADEQSRTLYLLEQPRVAFLGALLHAATRWPRRLGSVLSLAWRTQPGGVVAVFKHLIYVAEAAVLARELVRRGVEVLHNHIAENSATVAMYASMLSGIPFGMTVHGPGIFFHPRQWALGEKVRRSAFTACITDFCRSQCMLFSDVEAWSKLNVVRCAMGREFQGAIRLPTEWNRQFVFVGRLAPEKGIAVLVDAASQLHARGMDFRVVIVGDGPLSKDIEADIQSRGLAQHFVMAGWQSSEGVRRLLEDSRALVLPSFAEGLPVVIMESLAVGRPVVSTQIAGIPELVRPGETGWLVPPGSSAGLAAAMAEALACGPDDLTRMAKAGADRVFAAHSIESEVGKLEALLLTATVKTAA
ncbi:MAG TPA: glycosyltransferase [Roseateles sp.]